MKNYYALGQFDKCLDIMDKAIKIDPNDVLTYYNKACVYSLLKNTKDSVLNLKKAIELDKAYIDYSKDEKDLDNVRDSEEYKKIIS